MKLLAAAALLVALTPTMFMVATHNAGSAPFADPHPRTGTPDRPATMAYPPVLYVDNETGCHYLSTDAFQVLVPRLDRDGKQVCPRPGGAQPSPSDNK
ncbi:hypothetical protein ACQ4WP_03355 [Janthinobacterium sp. GB4P2]|uniref:hypothetical protein n=1 Tax=Janthinobacterium sp. GB4P2 TaxID=3424189 RepID=UPI003F24D3B5